MTNSSTNFHRATARGIPQQSALFIPGKSAYYADSYEVPLHRHDLNATEIYIKVVAATPEWVNILMRLREKIVPLLGLKKVGLIGSRAKSRDPDADWLVGQKIDIFTIRSLSEQEIIVGEDDSHLDFRLSLLKMQENCEDKIVLSMIVHVKNWLGRVYLKAILPFHKLIMKACLNKAVREGAV